MKEYTCNLCGKSINKFDIRMSFDVDIDGKKIETIDMHSHCFYKFMNKAKDELCVTIPAENIL